MRRGNLPLLSLACLFERIAPQEEIWKIASLCSQ
jgi:hypothetical protein